MAFPRCSTGYISIIVDCEKRDQRGAEDTLQQTEHDHLGERLRRAAHHRGHGESNQAGNEQIFPADRDASQPTGAVMIAAAVM